MRYTIDVPEEHIKNLCADYLQKMADKLRSSKRGRKPGKKRGRKPGRKVSPKTKGNA